MMKDVPANISIRTRTRFMYFRIRIYSDGKAFSRDCD